ncbi:DMT family transporter [Brevundimonas vesicularis]|uniref:DMT family transporter n=1 Tax=Brevundimonas vesicularis TaxID=41276 RepID=UPI0038D46DD0
MKPSLFQSRGGVLALATLCCLLWGSAMPGVKTGYELLAISADDLPSQVLFAGGRFALAGVLLLVVAVGMGKSIFRLTADQWRQLALLGLTQTTLQYVFFYIGLAHTTGVKASIMNAVGVFFSVVLAHWIYADDRLSLQKAAGCLIGFAGVVVVNLTKGSLGLDFSLAGEGFIVMAAFVLAAASIYGKRVSRRLDPIVMTAWQLLLGGLVLTGLGTGLGGRIKGLDWMSGSLLLYLALLSSVAFAVWSLLLKHNPVGVIAPFNFLVPIFGVVLSAAFLNESVLHWRYLIALVLVCGGIWMVTSRRGRKGA